MAGFALSATMGGASKHTWTKIHTLCVLKGLVVFHHPTTLCEGHLASRRPAVWNKFYLKIVGRHNRTKICAERHKNTFGTLA